MKRVISKKDIKDKAYPICTDSIGGKEGTNERSKWDDDAKDRYDRCLEEVSEKDMKESNVIFSVFKAAQEEMHNDELAQKLDQFSKLVSSHDLTYQYSDDQRYYSAGRNSYNRIRQVAEELKQLGAYDQAVTIWNSNVDQKLTPNARQGFYWQ